LEFDNNPTKIKARILPPPFLVKIANKKDHLIHWGVLNLAIRILNNKKLVNEFIEEVKR
jgi:hypothetical protein